MPLRPTRPQSTTCGSIQAINGGRRFDSIELVSRSRSLLKRAHSPAPPSLSSTRFRREERVGRQTLKFPDKPPYSVRVTLDGVISTDELVLSGAIGADPKPTELARQAIQVTGFEAEAVARPDAVVNPVDLGTILVPAEWLLLGPRTDGNARDRRDQSHARLARGESDIVL